jgi:hypothetical protein
MKKNNKDNTRGCCNLALYNADATQNAPMLHSDTMATTQNITTAW